MVAADYAEAMLAALCRRVERSRSLVERDFDNRSVCFYLFHLQNHWLMAPLRSDPRLHALFARAGLDVPAS